MSLSCTISKILLLISENLKTSRAVTTPIQGKICNTNVKPPPGEPVYKISSLYL